MIFLFNFLLNQIWPNQTINKNRKYEIYKYCTFEIMMNSVEDRIQISSPIFENYVEVSVIIFFNKIKIWGNNPNF